MSYYVRPMRREDILQVNEIDRIAFSTMWSSFNYEHELSNPLARYVVACCKDRMLTETRDTAFPSLASRIRQWFNHRPPSTDKSTPSARQLIVGFAGFWIMAGEAHITNIAVHDEYRRQGIGERILMAVMELAGELNAEFITLEVRTSNNVAQNLYRKYGFTEVGLRHGYYHDNGEDAILMSTEDLSSTAFVTRFQQLKQAHSRRWATLFEEIMQ